MVAGTKVPTTPQKPQKVGLLEKKSASVKNSFINI